MILYELRNLNENDPVYRKLEFSNYERQLGFLNSVVDAALKSGKPFLSQTVIKALNYHAVACLHSSAGEYRPCEVRVGDFTPPEHHRVPDIMDDFVNVINRPLGIERTKLPFCPSALASKLDSSIHQRER